MLISFSVENHLSFKGKNTLCLIKGLERRLPNHVCEGVVEGFKLLKGGVIYGANAGGKSNLIFSILAARNCVLENELVSDNRAFKLSSGAIKPIKFEFQFILDSSAYSYRFEILNSAVLSEELSAISSGKRTKSIFMRKRAIDHYDVSLAPHVRRSLGLKQTRSLIALLSTTPKNMLSLSDFAARKDSIPISKRLAADLLAPVKWLSRDLDIMRVGAKPTPFELEMLIEDDHEFRRKVEHVLKKVDPSIDHIQLEEFSGDLKSLVPDESAFLEQLFSAPDDLKGLLQLERRRYVITKSAGEISFERIIVVRQNDAGEEVKFELNEESEGIRRTIDLVPFFLKNKNYSTLIVDELDRSLHPEVTRLFHHLHYNSESDNQLVMATHEHYLLSQDFYRRDEIWFVDKDAEGRSNLYSLAEYDDIRFDKDIQKEYLRGTFGGVQNINYDDLSI